MFSANSDVSTKYNDVNGINAGMYIGTKDLIDTFGLVVSSGREFTADEYVEFDAAQKQDVPIPSIILTRALADQLFPDGKALGVLS